MARTLFTVIASGQTVSGDVDLRQFKLNAISVPVVSSGDLAVQGNVDTTSAAFTRLLDVRGQQGSGDLRFPIAAGSRMVIWPVGYTPAYIRLETIMSTGSAQTDNRTFVLQTSRR